MFLSENYSNFNGASADPMYAAQIIQESTDAWNDLCMKMVKLEHTAIMNNDQELLQEGLGEFASRAIENIKTSGQKFIEYLERVRVQWSKIQASIQTKMLRPDYIRALNEQLADGDLSYQKQGSTKTGKSYKVYINLTRFNTARQLVSSYGSIVGNVASAVQSIANHSANQPSNYLDDSREHFKVENEIDKYNIKYSKTFHFDNAGEEQEVTVTKQLITQAVDFLKARPVAIKNIETMKRAITFIMKGAIRNEDKENKPELRSAMVSTQRIFNKMIIAINKQTSTAIRICRVVKDPGALTADQKKQGNTVRRDRKSKYYLKESVLDDFSL